MYVATYILPATVLSYFLIFLSVHPTFTDGSSSNTLFCFCFGLLTFLVTYGRPSSRIPLCHNCGTLILCMGTWGHCAIFICIYSKPLTIFLLTAALFHSDGVYVPDFSVHMWRPQGYQCLQCLCIFSTFSMASAISVAFLSVNFPPPINISE